MLSHDNAARLFHSLRSDQDQQLRQQALENPEGFVQMAEQQGYHLQVNQLAAQVAQLSEEELAAIWNPGIGPRRHLIRR